MTGPALRRARDWAFLLGLASACLALDQYTKWLVVQNLAVGESWAPIPALARIFTITHTQNTGVAFGQLQSLGWVFMVFNVAVLVAVLVLYPRIPPGQWSLRVAAGLIVAGDLGNMTDRVRTVIEASRHTGSLWSVLPSASVTDMFDFKVWPIFNVADMCLVGGVAIVAWTLWQAERTNARRPAGDTEPAGNS